VVEDHRARNRPVHPPHPENLANAAAYQRLRHQLQQKETAEDALIQDGEDDEDDEGDTNEADFQKRANHHSKTPWGTAPKPTTLRYYSQSWQGVLAVAKSRMRRHIALVHAFPRREADLSVATKLISNALGEYITLEHHLPMEPGLFFLCSFFSYPDHNSILDCPPDRQMSILVSRIVAFMFLSQLLIIFYLGFQ
jgi:hypothetical protein